MFHYWISYSYSNKSAFSIAALSVELDTPIEYESDVRAAEQEVRKSLKANISDAVRILHWIELKGSVRPL